MGLFPWALLDGMDVNEAVDLFYDVLDSTIRDHIPTVVIRRKFPPWFDRELRALLKAKETAFRRLNVLDLRNLKVTLERKGDASKIRQI